MKWFLALILLLSGLLAGQNTSTAAEPEQAELLKLLASMPTCGLTCLETAIAASPCSATDLSCSCNNATLTAQVTVCAAQECTIKQQLTTKNTTDTLCSRPIRDQTHIVSYAGVIGCIIALIAYLIRMVSKVSFPCYEEMRIYNQLWWDDAVITLAMAEIISVSSLSVVLANLGLGKDVWTLPFGNISKILKIYYFDEDFYLTALPLVKISMCLTYMRIFQNPNFKKATWIVIALNVCYAIAFLLISVFQCRPIECAWTHWDLEHDCHCNNINAQGWTSAAFNVILDVLTLGLPLPMLWKMTLNKRKKFLVMLMFSLGFFVTIVSILRLQVLIEFGASQNPTWDYRAVGYWSTIELHAAVVCACMPAIRNFIRRFLPRLMGSTAEASAHLNQSGLSGPTAVGSGVDKGEPDVVVRRRDSDEINFILLRDVHTTSEPRTAGVPVNRRYPEQESGISWLADQKEDSIGVKPVSSLDR
ncbi:hypothetical protein AC579_6150 [Pseudocercospora musae]|uniref:CFEM domain-containing protein n=1 Tax=Pseudocercospora musae TaxID=113226 RepID=A0A139I4W3_9PEZI|nr:hypothetical protein AC579_6150 [Pseudocercospora musae]